MNAVLEAREEGGGGHAVTGLTPGTTYYLVAKSFVAGVASAGSNEVSATPVAPVDTQPPFQRWRWSARGAHPAGARTFGRPAPRARSP